MSAEEAEEPDPELVDPEFEDPEEEVSVGGGGLFIGPGPPFVATPFIFNPGIIDGFVAEGAEGVEASGVIPIFGNSAIGFSGPALIAIFRSGMNFLETVGVSSFLVGGGDFTCGDRSNFCA